MTCKSWGGIVLHQGNVAEMNTEDLGNYAGLSQCLRGQWLLRPIPIWITRVEEMGQVYPIGLDYGVPWNNQKTRNWPRSQREIYRSDVIYTTNTKLGFDYLTENLDGFRQMATWQTSITPLSMRLIRQIKFRLLLIAFWFSSSPPRRIIDTLIPNLLQRRGRSQVDDRKRVWLDWKGLCSRSLSAISPTSMIPNTVTWYYTQPLQASHKNFIKDKDYVIHPNVEGQMEIKVLLHRPGKRRLLKWPVCKEDSTIWLAKEGSQAHPRWASGLLLTKPL